MMVINSGYLTLLMNTAESAYYPLPQEGLLESEVVEFLAELFCSKGLPEYISLR